jgi:hypothetical protein
VSAAIPTEARIHPQPDAPQVTPLPAATVTALATLLAHLLVADLQQYPPGGRAPRRGGSPESAGVTIGGGVRELVAAAPPPRRRRPATPALRGTDGG